MNARHGDYKEPIEPLDSSLGALIDVVHDGVAVLDRLGVIRYISPANERNFARTPEQVTGHHVSEFIHPDDLPDILKRLARNREASADLPIIYRVRQPNGRWRWFEAITPQMAGHYVPDHFIFFIRDITNHRRIEQQYRMAERIAGYGVWRVDVDDPYPHLSPGMMHLFGFRSGEKVKRPKYWPVTMVHPADVKSVVKTLREVLRFPRLFSFCCRVHTKDGSLKVLQTRGHVETNADGEGVAIIGVSQDITHIRQAEKNLWASEQKYRLLTERASDIICQLSQDGVIEFISPSIKRIVGKDPDKLIGLSFKTLLAKDDYQKFDHFLTQLREGNHGILSTLRAKNGEREQLWLELSGSTLLDSSGIANGFVCTARDVTERKKFELDLQTARQQAEDANTSKSKFVSHISHELRTPLNAIMGFSELIREQPFGSVGDERYAEYAGLIHESGSILESLINDLLDLSKIEAGKYELHPESLELKEIVPACIRQIMPQAMEKNITVDDRISGMGLDVQVDKRALSQILINLLSNAVKFTPQDGRIELTAGVGHNRLRLNIHDTGIGIKKDDIARITKPFEQGEDEFRSPRTGTGLGLTLAKLLTELHGGELVIESAPGHGTTVSVLLPISVQSKSVA